VVSIADIESAERLVGIAYTAAERDQMVENLEGQIASAIARRKFRFDNSMPTASRFDPRLPNFRLPAPGSPRFSRAAVRPLPEDEADIAFASIGELAAWIGAGALTSRRLTEIYLSRIDALGPRLECFATVTTKRALAEAEAADALMRGGAVLPLERVVKIGQGQVLKRGRSLRVDHVHQRLVRKRRQRNFGDLDAETPARRKCGMINLGGATPCAQSTLTARSRAL
jgi:hypothetical protein